MSINNALPTIAHADVSLNQWGRVVIQMHEGYVFWDREHYVDEYGNYLTPEAYQLMYYRYGVFAPDTDFDARFVVVKDGEISDTEATEADYIAALEDLGVNFNE